MMMTGSEIVSDAVALTKVRKAPSAYRRTPYHFSDFQSGVSPPKGWDCADACDDGWTKENLDAFMKASVRPWTPPGKKSTDKPAERVERPAAPVASAPAGKPVPEAHEAISVDSDWRISLVCNEEGKVKPGVTKNWALFIEHHSNLSGIFAWDELRSSVMLMRRPPWGVKTGAWTPRQLNDIDLSYVVTCLEDFHMTPKASNIGGVISMVASEHSFHPVRDYLASLPKWDGVPRIDAWLTYYAGAEDTALNRAYARKFLCAAVRRVKVPGCKWDHVLVLAGPEGRGKSTILKALCHDPTWFTDQLKIGSSAKETIEQSGGAWITEMAELVGSSNRESEAVKHFLSAQVDKARMSYGRTVTDKPRQFVVTATTNNATILTSLTGNRRWFIVEVGTIDVSALVADRDQLWAEAVAAETNEKLHLDTPELADAQLAHNSAKTDYGDWYDLLSEKLPSHVDMKLPATDVWRLVGIGAGEINRITAQHRNQMKKALAGLGFDPNSRPFRRDGAQIKAYLRGDAASAEWWTDPDRSLPF